MQSNSSQNTKHCQQCNQAKNILQFGFSSSSIDGFQGICKNCKQSLKQELLNGQIDDQIDNQSVSKYCPCCQQVKPLSDFYPSTAHADGHTAYCKEDMKIMKKNSKNN